MKKKIVIIIVCLPILFWIGSLIKCEVLTTLHHGEFQSIYKDKTNLEEIDYLKVLHYHDDYAEVYYVSLNKSSGEVITYHKVDDEWAQKEWRTIWSGRGGSASGVIWPYWWHFIYGGL